MKDQEKHFLSTITETSFWLGVENFENEIDQFFINNEAEVMTTNGKSTDKLTGIHQVVCAIQSEYLIIS